LSSSLRLSSTKKVALFPPSFKPSRRTSLGTGPDFLFCLAWGSSCECRISCPCYIMSVVSAP
jgi:hypothetical protein